uniref:Uncharacterized protein n=1 Tax=Vitis vinifera TaxID=29760 RepID=F6H9E0_VITVI
MGCIHLHQPHHSPYAAARIRGIARSTVEDFSGDTTEAPLHTAASQHRKATHLEGGLAMRDSFLKDFGALS